MKKLSILIAAILLQSSAYAAEISVARNIETGKFTFNAKADTAVTIDIYAPGKSAADVTEDTADVIKYHNEIYGDAEGKSTFSAKLSGESGIYPAYVTADGEQKKINLEFVNAAKNKTAIEGLNSAADIESYIEENRADLGFFNELYDSVNKKEVAGIIKKSLPFNSGEPQKAIDSFNMAVTARAISEKKINGVSAYSDLISVLNDGGKYDKWYKLADAAAVDARLSGDYKSIEEFKYALGEAIVLDIVKNPNGYENVKLVMSDFSDDIGISSLTSKTAVYQSLAGGNYADYAALKKAYNGYVSSESNPGGGGGGGSSSGGSKGGSTGSTGGKVSTGTGAAFGENTKPTPIEKTYFEDMENAEWAKPAVWYLAEKGIVSGKSETEFCPSDSVNREEFVTMLTKAFGFEKIADSDSFDDVTKDKWFYDYVIAASQNGIVSGVGERLFGAGERITRQDMAAMLMRALSKKGYELAASAEEVEFADKDDIAEYAKEAVGYMQTRGIVSGMEDGTFRPNEYATRAQAAQMIYKIMEGKA